MEGTNYPRVPVIMYHSIGVPDPNWPWSFLTTDYRFFARQLSHLQQNGFRSVTLEEVTWYQAQNRLPPGRPLVLTFDDGYADNWTHAEPLLRYYGFRGVIYVSTDFLSHSDQPASQPDPATLATAPANAALPPTQLGFLTAAEVRRLAAGDVMDIQCHSCTHTWYPTAPRVIDVFGNGYYPWVVWNLYPHFKPCSFHVPKDLVPHSYPVFQHGRSLGIRRYFPAPLVIDRLTALLDQMGGAKALHDPARRRSLSTHLATLLESSPGRFETDQEMLHRYKREIYGSRDILQALTRQPVQHFCWPGGAYNEMSWRLAMDAGYISITASRRNPSTWHSNNPRILRRISPYVRLTVRGIKVEPRDPALLALACRALLGHPSARILLSLKKIRWLALHKILQRGYAGNHKPVLS